MRQIPFWCDRLRYALEWAHLPLPDGARRVHARVPGHPRGALDPFHPRDRSAGAAPRGARVAAGSRQLVAYLARQVTPLGATVVESAMLPEPGTLPPLEREVDILVTQDSGLGQFAHHLAHQKRRRHPLWKRCRSRNPRRGGTFQKMSRVGLEPTTYGLKVRCSTN